MMKNNLLDRIQRWWRFEGRHIPRNIRVGIRNLWQWAPTIWRDRDWDGHYIYELLRVKLEHQAAYIGDRDIRVESKRDAERMRLVARLIKLQQDETYGMEYMDYHDTKYEFVPTDASENWYIMEEIEISECFDAYFAKYPRQYKRVISGEINRYRRPPENNDKKLIAMEIAHENQSRCQRLIFDIMHDHIERWWD
jgi:hypothetical protein